MDDARRREPSVADIKAEKEAQYKRSLAYSIEKARACRARMEAQKGNTVAQQLKNLIVMFKNLNAKLARIQNRQA